MTVSLDLDLNLFQKYSRQTDLDLNCLKVISRPLDGKRNKLAFTVFILLTFPKHQSHLQRTLSSLVSPTQW